MVKIMQLKQKHHSFLYNFLNFHSIIAECLQHELTANTWISVMDVLEIHLKGNLNLHAQLHMHSIFVQ